MLKGFRDFVLRGNVVDLAVAVVIGAAFTGIVNSMVKDIINPLIAATVGQPNFSSLVVAHPWRRHHVRQLPQRSYLVSDCCHRHLFWRGLPVSKLLDRFKPVRPRLRR